MRKAPNRLLESVRRVGLSLAASICVLLLTTPLSAQCVMCRESLKSGGSRELITGFIFSTLLLTAVPVTLLSVFAFVIYRSVKRQAALEGAMGVPSAADAPGGPPASV